MGRRKEADQPNKATVEARSERWRESIQASSILNRLKDHGDGKLQKPLEATQIKAYEVILDRIAPKLSAVEQTNVGEHEAKSPEQLVEQVRALITANPELLAKLNLTAKPVLAASSEGKEAEAA